MSAEMDALVARTETQLEALEQAIYEINGIRAVYTSPDGLVEATADGHGALVDLWLAEQITRRPAGDIGPLIVDAAGQAVAEAGRLRSGVMATLNNRFTSPT